jgi:hypothetical protein
MPAHGTQRFWADDMHKTKPGPRKQDTLPDMSGLGRAGRLELHSENPGAAGDGRPCKRRAKALPDGKSPTKLGRPGADR